MTKIFISYRRDDSAAWAGRLYERLARDFKKGDLFIDVDNIAYGDNFVDVLDEKVGGCDVFLAVIGPKWLSSTNPEGKRRLDDQHDFVRIEIESALKRNVRLIPVLIDGAELPNVESLPKSLQPLLTRQSRRLSHSSFPSDAAALVSQIASSTQLLAGKGIGALKSLLLVVFASLAFITWAVFLKALTPGSGISPDATAATAIALSILTMWIWTIRNS